MQVRTYISVKLLENLGGSLPLKLDIWHVPFLILIYLYLLLSLSRSLKLKSVGES